MSEKVAILTLSLFVTGYCVGYVSYIRISNHRLILVLKTDIMGAFVRTIWPTANFHNFLFPLRSKSKD